MLLLLYPQHPRAAVESREVFLDPDFSTLWIQPGVTTHNDCEPWPIRTGEPSPYHVRGTIRDKDGFPVGRYLARGVLRNSDGANVTEYEMYIKGLPKVMWGLDAEPLAFGYDVYGWAWDGSYYRIDPLPVIEPGCTWDLRWQLTITKGEE